MRLLIFLPAILISACASSSPAFLMMYSAYKLNKHGEGNGNPLQYSCLENPVDIGAWWAAVQRVAQSQTWLKRLSSSSRQYIKKQRHYMPTKVRLVKAMVFLVVMYGCESWTIKKAECQRIDVLNCGIGEDSWESLGLQDQTSQS